MPKSAKAREYLAVWGGNCRRHGEVQVNQKRQDKVRQPRFPHSFLFLFFFLIRQRGADGRAFYSARGMPRRLTTSMARQYGSGQRSDGHADEHGEKQSNIHGLGMHRRPSVCQRSLPDRMGSDRMPGTSEMPLGLFPLRLRHQQIVMAFVHQGQGGDAPRPQQRNAVPHAPLSVRQ